MDIDPSKATGYTHDGRKIPFIVCETLGGHLDDIAFSYGFQCGVICENLSNPDFLRIEVYAFEDIVEQLDLMAMSYGFIMKVLAREDDMAHLLFTRMPNFVSVENA